MTGLHERSMKLTLYQRRRAQNCVSQRAFRERKAKYVKTLEHQLEELHEKHQSLLKSYTKQVDEVSRLNSCIAELSTELTALRQYQGLSSSDLIILNEFDEFDACSLTDTIYNTDVTCHDKTLVDLNSEAAYPKMNASS